MKRYLLFAGDAYYPSGGWDDYVGDFDDIEQAKGEVMGEKRRCDWFHVVDRETGEEVLRKWHNGERWIGEPLPQSP